MIRFGLRLTLRGGREAATRLVAIAIAVALGVGMLLIAVAGINAVNSQNSRYAWLETGAAGRAQVEQAIQTRAGVDPMWWLLSADTFQGKVIGRVDIAATGPHSPLPPGVPRLPQPGEYYASPAMISLLDSTPANELADRYPGRLIGTIGADALPAANSLLILIGRPVGQVAALPGAHRITAIDTTPPSQCNGPGCYAIGIDGSGIDLILAVAAAALLFPVLIFIGQASRLSAARREQRFAAMRLVGATPAQITVISTVESTVASALGAAMGFGVFFALRPPLATIPFTGAPFYTHDLSLSLPDVLLVAVGIPVAAAVAARIALRRVQISPLGVTRRVTPRPPRAWRLIPLVVGLGELAYYVHHGRPLTTQGQVRAYLPGFLITMAGLVLAGPWLTMAGSRLMVRWTRRPSVLVAGRRLGDNPKAGFRAVSGLVLAMFVTSVAIGMLATINFYNGSPIHGKLADDTVIDQLTDFVGPGTARIQPVPPPLLAQLNAIPGVTGIAEVHRPRADADPFGPAGNVSCAQLAAIPAIGSCPPGATVATIAPTFAGNSGGFAPVTRQVGPQPAPIPLGRLAGTPVKWLAVATDGSIASVERVRTDLEDAFPVRFQPVTITEFGAQSDEVQRTRQYRQLVNVVLLTSLPIAGCSLAVAVAAGLSDRKRAFSLLRLAGAPLAMLRRVVMLETAVPLAVIAVLSSGVGFVATAMFVRSQLNETLQPPGASYFILAGAGLVASLAIIASTFPLLTRITGAETARND